MKVDLIINNIKTIYTSNEIPPVKGFLMNNIKTIHNGYIAIKGGKIISLGEGKGFEFKDDNTIIEDAKGKIMLPGFIDSHSHLVHAGSRENEYEDLKKGVPYLDILNRGGGILGTVDKTRKATFNELYNKALNSLDKMLEFGVTVLESKSGYGLNYETEKKQLLVNKKLNENHPIFIKSTYMGAHAIPTEFKENREAYINSMITDMDKFKNENLFDAVDVFCEDSVFSIKETEYLLNSAKKLGYTIKMHADEIVSLGGAGLGANLGCTSVDHLMAISDGDIKLLANSNTVANLLPGTSFYLKKEFARARTIIDNGVAVSIAGDYNPGSCPTENFQFVMSLASNYLKMSAEEILTAVTINPAYHLGLSNTKGSLEVNKDADMLLIDSPNLIYMFYHFGINHVTDVYIKGEKVVNNKIIVRDKYGINKT